MKLSPELPEDVRLLKFTISPTSSHVGFQTHNADTLEGQVYSSSMDGSFSANVTGSVSDVSSTLRFSGGGTRILFSTFYFNNGNFSDLYSAPTSGGLPVKLNGSINVDADDEFLFTAPDDSRAVFFGRDQQIYSTSLTGGPITQVSQPLVENSQVDHTTPPAVTPSGSHILYNNQLEDDSYSYMALNARTTDGVGPQIRIGESLGLESRTFNSLVLSSNGSRVIFRAAENFVASSPRLYSADTDGSSTPLELSSDGISTFTNVANGYLLSPNDADVVFRAGSELYSVPATDGTIQQLTPTTAHSSFALAQGITPDSSKVLYVGDKTTDHVEDLYAVPIGGGDSLKLNDALPAAGDVKRDSATLTPDGSRVIYRADRDVDQRFELFSVPIQGGDVVKLNAPSSEPTTPDADGKVSFSGDGEFALFSQDLGGGLRAFAVPVAGGPMYPITEPGISYFQVSPDGLKVVYTTSDLLELYATGIPVTRVSGGQNVAGQVAGGLGFPGGIGFEFDSIDQPGIFEADYTAEAIGELDPGLVDSIDFMLSGDTPQLWSFSFDGSFSDSVLLTFTYNESLLGPGVDESSLAIFHQLEGGVWEELATLARDLDANTITVEADSFSYFGVGVVPEPSTVVLLAMGAVGWFVIQRRSRRGC